MRFVIADDMHTPRMVLTRILTEAGHEVVGAGKNGSEAVELIQQHKPDAAIFDISMPGGMMGDEAARKVREIFPDMFLFIASNIDNESITKRLESDTGAYFIVKPYRTGQLLNALAHHIGA